MARKFEKISHKEFQLMKERTMKVVSCNKHCGNEVEVESHVEEATCWRCTTMLAPPEERLLKSREELQQEIDNGFPKGWRFMGQFVHQDGTVYERGVEKPELKGTLEPTDIEALRKQRKKSKKTVREKNLEEEQHIQKLAKKHEKAKLEKEKAKIQKENSVLVSAPEKNVGPSISTNRSQIIAEVTVENGVYKAKDGVIDYTALVDNQPKLKYVFEHSKKVIGKQNDDGTYTWRGCK